MSDRSESLTLFCDAVAEALAQQYKRDPGAAATEIVDCLLGIAAGLLVSGVEAEHIPDALNEAQVTLIDTVDYLVAEKSSPFAILFAAGVVRDAN